MSVGESSKSDDFSTMAAIAFATWLGLEEYPWGTLILDQG